MSSHTAHDELFAAIVLGDTRGSGKVGFSATEQECTRPRSGPGGKDGALWRAGLFSPDQTAYSALHTPIAYFIGGSSDIAYSNSESDYMNIYNVPIFDGNDDVEHGATWGDVNAGEFGRVNLGWLKWQLMGDMTAGNMFVGSNCELCTSTVWTVKKKNIPWPQPMERLRNARRAHCSVRICSHLFASRFSVFPR